MPQLPMLLLSNLKYFTLQQGHHRALPNTSKHIKFFYLTTGALPNSIKPEVFFTLQQGHSQTLSKYFYLTTGTTGHSQTISNTVFLLSNRGALKHYQTRSIFYFTTGVLPHLKYFYNRALQSTIKPKVFSLYIIPSTVKPEVFLLYNTGAPKHCQT